MKEKAMIADLGTEEVKRHLFAKRKVVHSCWEWTGVTFASGYGRLYHKNGKISIRSHRLSYAAFIGPLKRGLVIDHKCRNKKCFNPSHLRQVTVRQNSTENSLSFAAVNLNKTHCINGHKLTAENTYNQKGTTFRYCRACSRARNKKHYYKPRSP